MKKKYLICIALIVLNACKEKPNSVSDETHDTIINKKSDSAFEKIVKSDIEDCKEEESLLWEGESFVSYTENRMRGNGVISFMMDINDRLDVLNEDDTNFGEIVLNEDMTFFTLTMPKKVVARKVIATYDFAAFDFDCENVDADRNYFIIYVNKEKRKVKKSDLKYTFSTWKDYIKKQSVKLKNCNLITDEQGNVNQKSKDQVFTVNEINDDEIKISSSKNCSAEDSPFHSVNGQVKWKSGNVLLIDFAICN
jgi:hypothetical protein